LASKQKRLVGFPTVEEFRAILKAEKRNNYKLAYVLGFGSGLRLSEIVGPAPNSNQDIKPLMPEQVNLNNKQIKVFGKGGKERITTINPLFPLRESMIKLLPLHIERRTIQKAFGRTTERVLKRKLHFHSLRHGFGNHMVNDRGLPLPMVQGFLGHSRLDTTGIYTKANPVQAINKVWEGF